MQLVFLASRMISVCELVTDTSNSTYTFEWDCKLSHLVSKCEFLKIVVSSVKIGLEMQKLYEVNVRSLLSLQGITSQRPSQLC
jgi:hypothetical protein